VPKIVTVESGVIKILQK